jgi:hypothetical protein
MYTYRYMPTKLSGNDTCIETGICIGIYIDIDTGICIDIVIYISLYQIFLISTVFGIASRLKRP